MAGNVIATKCPTCKAYGEEAKHLRKLLSETREESAMWRDKFLIATNRKPLPPSSADRKNDIIDVPVVTERDKKIERGEIEIYGEDDFDY